MLAIICIPKGMLLLSNPQGIDIAGYPVNEANVVYISSHSELSSLHFSPILKAVVVVVGNIIKSYFSKIFLKESLNSSLSLLALSI